MKNYGIYCYKEKDSILNNPGQFFFQITEENEFKTTKTPISKKLYDEIKNNLINSFKKISENLKILSSSLNSQSHRELVAYYTDVYNKLDKFTNNCSNRGFTFPGLQVISLTSKQVELFTKLKERVLICEKSDGVRYLLVQFANGKTVMLGRNLEFYFCEFTEKLPLSNNNQIGNLTIQQEWEIVHLIDGELILDEVEIPHRDPIEENIFGTDNNDFLNNEDLNGNYIEKFLYNNDQKNSMVFINEKLYKTKFVVFDAIILNRENFGHLKFVDRIYRLSKFVNSIRSQKSFIDLKEKFLGRYSKFMDNELKEKIMEYSDRDNNTASYDKIIKFKIEIFMKDYFTFDKIKFLYEKVSKNLPHENDGIILNLDDYPYYTGESSEIFKWKPRNMNTCDFEIDFKRFHRRNNYDANRNEKENFEKIILLKVHEKKDKSHDVNILNFQNKDDEEKFIKECIVLKNSSNRIVVECYFEFNRKVVKENLYKYEILKKNEYPILQDVFLDSQYSNTHKNGYWKFMRFRKDKLYGNSLQTFFKVWESIEDNLTIENMQEKIDHPERINFKIDGLIERHSVPISTLISKITENQEGRDYIVKNTEKEVNLINQEIFQKNQVSETPKLLNRKRSQNSDSNLDSNINSNINNNLNPNLHSYFQVIDEPVLKKKDYSLEENKISKAMQRKEEKNNLEMNRLKAKKQNTQESLNLAFGALSRESGKEIKENTNENFNKKLVDDSDELSEESLTD